MSTRGECIEAAGRIAAAAEWELLTAPVDEQVERAWTPTGPSKPELRAWILALRAQAA